MTNGIRFQIGYRLAMLSLTAKRNGMLEELFAKGKATVIGYRLFKYGHLAIVVEDPDQPGRKVLFTSQGQKGVNIDEDIDSLRTLIGSLGGLISGIELISKNQ